MSLIDCSQVYEQVVEDPYKDTGDEDTMAFTGEINENFPAMRDWILEYITDFDRRGYVG